MAATKDTGTDPCPPSSSAGGPRHDASNNGTHSLTPSLGSWCRALVQRRRRSALSPRLSLLQAAIQCERGADSRAIEGGTVSQGIAEHRATDRTGQKRRKTSMTRSSFNRMIVPSAASIWGDLSHGVDCLRIGTATAAADCMEKPCLSLSLCLCGALSLRIWAKELGKVGRVCTYLTWVNSVRAYKVGIKPRPRWAVNKWEPTCTMHDALSDLHTHVDGI